MKVNRKEFWLLMSALLFAGAMMGALCSYLEAPVWAHYVLSAATGGVVGFLWPRRVFE